MLWTCLSWKKLWFLLAGLLAVAPLHAQQDSLVSPSSTLRWSRPAFDKVFDLAVSLRYELGLCGIGHVRTDTAVVDDVTFPGTIYNDSLRVVANTCPPDVVVGWHNHVWTKPDSGLGFFQPADLCTMSWPDIATAYARGFPWAAIGVADGDHRLHLCWWSREQIVAAYHSGASVLRRIPRQGILGSREAAIDAGR